MFETHDDSEIVIPFFFNANGERLWTHVGLRIHSPWLHVVYKVSADNEFESSSMVFLSRTDQLLVLQRQTGITIEQVDIVTPSYMNGGTRWKMDPLQEIWEEFEPGMKNQQKFLIYVLESGKRFLYSAIGTKKCDLKDQQLIFKI